MRAFAYMALALALAASLVACAASESVSEPWLGAGSVSMAETLSFGSDGRTQRFELPAVGASSLALWVRSEPGHCFALEHLEDGTGAPWVSHREAGPYCTGCRMRTSSVVSEALFVLSDPVGASFAGDLQAQFGLLDCRTLTPITISAATSSGEAIAPGLEVRFVRRERVPTHVVLSLRLLFSSRSTFLGSAEQQRELMAGLNRELSSTGIEARLEQVVALTSTPDRVTFSVTELDELSALRAVAPPPLETTVDVIVAGCLMYDDPFFGPPVSVEGFTPRVVGGAGPADAVFLPALRCDGSMRPLNPSADREAHLLAHELGHFLGLYHSVEADGTTDLLSDTGPDNTMHHDPRRAQAMGFSALQAHHMRSHPWVRSAPSIDGPR